MANTNIVKEIMELEHFKTLTPIQKQVMDRKNKTRDLIGISSTGSGKSHAFFMAIFEQVDPTVDAVQAVISTPTRELAFQLYERCKKLAAHFGVRVKLVTGGMDRKVSDVQPQIVIGTPGRMKDLFVQENTLRLDTAKMVIIDEADMTLEFGFLEDIDEILSKMNKKVQLMVFSATIPEDLQPFLKKYLFDPFMISIEDSENFQSDVRHVLVPCKHKTYEEKLLDVLSHINPYVCLIFANTNQEAAKIAAFLREHQYDLVELHGDLESRERMQAIKTIQSQKKSYIVASDIASRGIDLEGITHVISCGFPKDLKFYVHRSGRTGRANRDGVCYALYHEKDEVTIKDLMHQGIVFEHQDIRHGQWVDLKPFGQKRKRSKDPLQQEIEKIVSKKAKKVKPNYKKKQRQEIEKLKRKRKREIIQKDIQRQKKERAKEKQRQKRFES
ncbi:DEAD/DEAH box helicase [Faecalicoccus pleomorphus]|uniref:DEAD/DEAH box helicase n=1 Tax=Faecalicoccus pleomorphus TaxID=1323 RepID=UPI001897BCE4|nr:DEAD/DEAH box helicase [Faecalicoccus pleomorphus]MDB7985501.1 DEAD/DEAH box helicase [Faecalicoccus pleomorphus]